MQLTRKPLAWTLIVYSIHLVAVWWWAWTHAPNDNEWAHLAAGLNYVSKGQHDLYVVNPPLTRLVAGAGGRLGGIEFVQYTTRTRHQADGDDRPGRPEFGAGEWIRDTYRKRAWLALRCARTLMAVVAASGVLGLYFAGRALGRADVGLGAALLWAMSPTMLSWCGTLNPDATAAAAIAWLTAAIALDLRSQRAASAALLGLTLGIGLVTKLTLLVCVPPTLLTAVFARLLSPPAAGRWRRAVCHPILTAFAAYAIVLAAYGSPPNLRPLGSQRYYSSFFTQVANSPLARFPALIPHEMLTGLDVQQYDLEHPRPTYVAGRHYEGRVWWYYLYCWLVKEPPAAVFAALLGIVLVALRCAKRDPTGWVIVAQMLPGIAVWLIISAHGEFTNFYRYAYPGLPALWLAGGCALAALKAQSVLMRGIHRLVVGSLLTSAVTCAPHWTSYISEAVGGPLAGARHVAGQCLDWGQDIPALAAWARTHQGSWPLYVATPLRDPLELYGLPQARRISQPIVTRFPPGWYAVSLTTLLQTPERYGPLIEAGPVDRIGYSIYLFFLPAGKGSPQEECASQQAGRRRAHHPLWSQLPGPAPTCFTGPRHVHEAG